MYVVEINTFNVHCDIVYNGYFMGHFQSSVRSFDRKFKASVCEVIIYYFLKKILFKLVIQLRHLILINNLYFNIESVIFLLIGIMFFHIVYGN